MSNTIHIVYVDDSPEDRFLLKMRLRKHNKDFILHQCDNVDEAMATLSSLNCDCIVSDYQMPVLNGLDFLKALREENPDVPFILLTGQGDESIAADAFRAGANDYFSKSTDEIAQTERLVNSIKRNVTAYRILLDKISTEKELAETLSKYCAIAESSFEGVVVSQDGLITEANDAAVSMFRTTRDKMLGKSPLDFAASKDRDLVSRLISEKFAGEYRASFVSDDGVEHPMLVRGRSIMIDGQLARITAFRLDE
jgi:PAS domain S-box-containing protein